MIPYFAYIRVSTGRQAEQGSSLKEQKSAIEAYAAHAGLTIVECFEEHETAATLGRREFNRMMGGLERREALGVIIHKIDRSARNLKDWSQLGELIDRGIDVRFVHESLNLGTRGGRLAADIQAVVAADYVRNLREEVRKGFYGRLKQGLYPLPAPVGYRSARNDTPVEGSAKSGSVKSIDPVRGPLVRTVFELFASGKFTLDTIGEEMRRRGLHRKNGRALPRCTFARILRNPFYIGIIRIKRTGETFEGAHKALIPKALFERVQAVLDGRLNVRNFHHDFLFRRLIQCEACKRTLTGEHQKGHVYYRCHGKACRGTSVRESDVAAQLAAFLDLLRFPDEDLRDIRDLVDEDRALAERSAEAERSRTKQALGLCEGRLTRLTDAFLDRDIDKETFEDRKRTLLLERRGLLDALAAPEATPPTDRLLERFELGNTAYLGLSSPNPDEQREAVEKVSSNLSVCGKNIAIEPRFPFYEVAKWRISQQGGPCGVELRKGHTPSQPGNHDYLLRSSAQHETAGDETNCAPRSWRSLFEEMLSNQPPDDRWCRDG